MVGQCILEASIAVEISLMLDLFFLEVFQDGVAEGVDQLWHTTTLDCGYGANVATIANGSIHT